MTITIVFNRQFSSVKRRGKHHRLRAIAEDTAWCDPLLPIDSATPGKEDQVLQSDLDCCACYDLANRNIQQVSLRVAKLMLPVPAASKQVHDDLILGFDIGWLGSQILRVVLRQDFNVIFKSL